MRNLSHVFDQHAGDHDDHDDFRPVDRRTSRIEDDEFEEKIVREEQQKDQITNGIVSVFDDGRLMKVFQLVQITDQRLGTNFRSRHVGIRIVDPVVMQSKWNVTISSRREKAENLFFVSTLDAEFSSRTSLISK